jgi:hypothetical protein
MFPAELVLDLREAWAENGRQESSEEGLCWIGVRPLQDARGLSCKEIVAEVDFPPLEGIARKRTDLTISWNEMWFTTHARHPGGKPAPVSGPAPSSPFAEAARRFLKLAGRLGAYLPREVRQTLVSEKVPVIRPAALWCLLLFRDDAIRGGISQNEIEQLRDGVARPWVRAWDEPFHSSLDLVERLQSAPSKLTVPGTVLPTSPPGSDREGVNAMTPSVKKAYLSFLYAEAKAEKRLEDIAAYEWLRENGLGDDADELVNYELPIFKTWTRYLRRARSATGEQKYTPRRGRSSGKSIVDFDAT